MMRDWWAYELATGNKSSIAAISNWVIRNDDEKRAIISSLIFLFWNKEVASDYGWLQSSNGVSERSKIIFIRTIDPSYIFKAGQGTWLL
tara:strand:- start:481 stop:747 length:267 start_codon:yes stop_codon:yes gene_type:complete